MQSAASNIAELVDCVAQFYDDPLGYVYFAFPWGQEGTQLAEEDGPDEWQIDTLQAIGDGALTVEAALQIAVSSGHGIGKTALVAWIILWFISTRPNPQIVVTANTKEQLEKKTWRELSKWHKLAVNGEWFEWTATKFYLKDAPERWFASAIPWSKERSEAFAGTHEEHVLMIFDEASAIDDIIWEVAEGAMTTPGAIWIAFGNPTRNKGRFAEAFKKFRHRWTTRQIDSRTAKKVNKQKVEQWISDYGEDSDFVRVRVRGIFPRSDYIQFIGDELVEEAKTRDANVSWQKAPKVMGIDVARHGDDESVVRIRQGLKAHLPKVYRVPDTNQLARHIAEDIMSMQPDAVLVDATGIGWGVIDTLRSLGHKVQAIQTGEQASQHDRYYNLRAEVWGKMRDWLKEGGDIHESEVQLADDLTGPKYGFDNKNRIQLEKKEDMKARGLASPDRADALALTFAMPVVARARHIKRRIMR